MQLPTQQQFVADCLSKYWFTDIPADQQWEAAHFPLPGCSGEGDTVLLWSADHTVQGLLQSVELDHQCFYHKANSKDLYNLETYYPQYLQLFAQLKSRFYSRRGKIGGKIGGKTAAELKVGAHAPGIQSKGGKKSAVTNRANGTGLYDPKIQSAGGKIVGNQRWQCLETGFIANPGNLARYQKKRGIDTSLRIQLPADLPGQIPSPIKAA